MVSCAILSIIWYKDPFTLSWGGACLLDFRRPFSTIFLFFTVMLSVKKGSKDKLVIFSYLYWTWKPWPRGQTLPRARFRSPSGAATSSCSFSKIVFHQFSYRLWRASTLNWLQQQGTRLHKKIRKSNAAFTVTSSKVLHWDPSFPDHCWERQIQNQTFILKNLLTCCFDRNKSKWHRVGRSSIEPHYTPLWRDMRVRWPLSVVAFMH